MLLNSKKLFAVILILTALPLLFSGCASDTPEETVETTAEAVETPKNYIIILPQSATAKITESANGLAESMSKLLGKTPDIIKENRLDGEVKNDPSSFFILIGMTDFSQTADVYEDLPYGAQTVTSKQNTLIIGGWFEDATVAAINSSKKLISEWASNGRLDIPTDFVKTVVLDDTLCALPKLDGQKPSDAVDCGDGAMMMIFKSSKKAYDSYLQSLPEAEFRQYAENSIGNILFSTSENGTYALHTVSYTGTGETRLIIEPLRKSALAPLPTVETSTETPVTLTQIGLNQSGGESDYAGMSYLYHLDDGSFIVIDGGYARDEDARRLYNCMKKQTADGEKIVIAAWIFTHGHADHAGCFMNFTNLYLNEVTVERFIYNDPCAEQRNITGDAPYYRQNQIEMQKYSGAVIHKAHPGQVYAIRNALVTIYYTLELYAPKDLEYYNDCSIVFSVEAGCHKTMFLGDISENVSTLIASLYRNELDCDLLQVAHHGFAGGTAPLYQYLAPSHLLWPSSDNVYETRVTADRFSTLTASAKTDNCYVAGYRIITLLLDHQMGIVKLSEE